MNKTILLPAFYIFITLLIAFYSISKPEYNWDTLPYAACVFSLESQDTNTIHERTYSEVKNNVPLPAYELMISSNDYRKEMFKCPGCFYEQLPFYKIRPLYILLIYLFYKLGFNIVKAPIIISSLSCFVISLFLFLWLKQYYRNIVPVFILSLLISVSPFLLNSASEASPNAISAMLVFIALFLLSKDKIKIFLILMVLSITARPDNLLLIILFSSAIIFSKEKDRKSKILLLAGNFAGIIVFFINNMLSGNYSWAILFEHSFNDRIINPATYTSVLNLRMYLSSFLKWAVLFKFSFISVQCILIVILFYIKPIRFKNIMRDPETCLLFAVMLSVFFHYLIYPVMDDKYFIAQYLLIDIIFIKNIMERIKTGEPDVIPGK